MAHARVALRRGTPVLSFGFLVYQESGKWIGRSVLSSHVSEGATFREAVDHLTEAIDIAVEIAARKGISPMEWRDRQRPDDLEYLRQFIELMSEDAKIEQTTARLHGAEMRASIIRAA